MTALSAPGQACGARAADAGVAGNEAEQNGHGIDRNPPHSWRSRMASGWRCNCLPLDGVWPRVVSWRDAAERQVRCDLLPRKLQWLRRGGSGLLLEEQRIGFVELSPQFESADGSAATFRGGYVAWRSGRDWCCDRPDWFDSVVRHRSRGVRHNAFGLD